MGLIEDIAQLMLREGEIKAQEGRERIAAEEEQRQNKHRALKMTLKALATIGPYFIPGVGPFIGPLVNAGMAAHEASNRGIGSDEDRLRVTRFSPKPYIEDNWG